MFYKTFCSVPVVTEIHNVKQVNTDCNVVHCRPLCVTLPKGPDATINLLNVVIKYSY